MRKLIFLLLFASSLVFSQTHDSTKDSLEFVYNEKLQQELDSLKADFELQKQKMENKYNVEREQYSNKIQGLVDSLTSIKSIPIVDTPVSSSNTQSKSDFNKNEEKLLYQYLTALKVKEKKKSSFLKKISQSGEKIVDFQIKEMNLYHEKYFPHARCEKIQSYIIDLALENKLYARAEMEFLKYAFLYNESANYALTLEKHLTDISDIKFFQERIPFLNKTINTILKKTPLSERYFNFVDILNSYPENEVNIYLMKEAEKYLTLFSDEIYNAKVVYYIAKHYQKGKEFQKAYITADKIMKIYPGQSIYSDALYMQGNIQLTEFKEYQSSISTFEAFIEKYPNNPKSQTSMFHIAKTYDEKLKEYEKAISYYKQFAEKYPQSKNTIPGLKRSAIIYYKELKSLQSAVDTYLLIEEKYPNTSYGKNALYHASLLYEEKKYYKNAVVQFAEVYKRYPDTKEALSSLEKSAIIYLEKLEDIENGKKVLSIIMEQFPESKSAKEAIERLSAIQTEEEPGQKRKK